MFMVFKGGNVMKSKSYLIIKPDGLKMSNKIIDELSRSFTIEQIVPIQNFCPMAMELYLDPLAIERGNQPIILGINTVWVNHYSESALLITVEAKEEKTHQDDFVMQVCHFKKEFRRNNIPNGYVEYTIKPSEIAYDKFNACPPSPRLRNKRLSTDGDYKLQLNSLHCPDSVESYLREISIISKYLNIKNDSNIYSKTS